MAGLTGNARPWPQPQRNKVISNVPQLPGKGKFVESRVNGGMITELDAADIPNGALQVAFNARCRLDRTFRRPGMNTFEPAGTINFDPVIGLFFHKKTDGTSFFFKFTPQTIKHRESASWQGYSGSGGSTLTGSESDRHQFVTFNTPTESVPVFSTNGHDVLKKLDTTAFTHQPLGNAPEYRFVTGFYNRIFAANLQGSTPNASQFGWSGENNIDEWDPLVDETAGSIPLTESPGDLGDDITGIFGFTNTLVILREHSIWIATKQPIPTFPVNPYCAFPGVGCDAPYTAVMTENSLTWLDWRTGTVWNYVPGQAPTPIGRPVEHILTDPISDPDLLFGSYNPLEGEYTVCIPDQNAYRLIHAWTYNFRTQSWVKDTYWGITTISNADVTDAVLSIDDLEGTINDLNPPSGGTINELGAVGTPRPLRTFGRYDGSVTLEDENEDTDIMMSSAGDQIFTTDLLSKAFTFPTDDMYVAMLRIELQIIQAGSVTFGYSKSGNPDDIATPTKTRTFGGGDVGRSRIFTWTKQIKARRFSWRLTALNGQFAVLSYEVHVYKSGESRQETTT